MRNSLVMREVGLEPTRQGHWILSPALPPVRRGVTRTTPHRDPRSRTETRPAGDKSGDIARAAIACALLAGERWAR